MSEKFVWAKLKEDSHYRKIFGDGYVHVLETETFSRRATCRHPRFKNLCTSIWLDHLQFCGPPSVSEPVKPVEQAKASEPEKPKETVGPAGTLRQQAERAVIRTMQSILPHGAVIEPIEPEFIKPFTMYEVEYNQGQLFGLAYSDGRYVVTLVSGSDTISSMVIKDSSVVPVEKPKKTEKPKETIWATETLFARARNKVESILRVLVPDDVELKPTRHFGSDYYSISWKNDKFEASASIDGYFNVRAYWADADKWRTVMEGCVVPVEEPKPEEPKKTEPTLLEKATAEVKKVFDVLAPFVPPDIQTDPLGTRCRLKYGDKLLVGDTSVTGHYAVQMTTYGFITTTQVIKEGKVTEGCVVPVEEPKPEEPKKPNLLDKATAEVKKVFEVLAPGFSVWRGFFADAPTCLVVEYNGRSLRGEAYHNGHYIVSVHTPGLITTKQTIKEGTVTQ